MTVVRRTRIALVAAFLAAGLLTGAALAAGPVERVLFKPVGTSGVVGSATLGANGVGTKISVRVAGLRPGSRATVLVRTGRFPRLSASFAKAVTLKADSRGIARASSALRFHDEPVSWTLVADGDHVLTVVAGGKIVAYAEIPGMD